MIHIIRIKDALTPEQIEYIASSQGYFTMEPYPYCSIDEHRYIKQGDDYGSVCFYKLPPIWTKYREERILPAPFTGFYACEGGGALYPLDPLRFESYCGATNDASALDANPIFAVVGDTLDEIKEWSNTHTLEDYIYRKLHKRD